MRENVSILLSQLIMMAAADCGGPSTDMGPGFGTSGYVTLEKPFPFSFTYRRKQRSEEVRCPRFPPALRS